MLTICPIEESVASIQAHDLVNNFRMDVVFNDQILKLYDLIGGCFLSGFLLHHHSSVSIYKTVNLKYIIGTMRRR